MKQLKIFGYIESWLPSDIDWFLQDLEKDEEFEVLISSPGGSALAGITAYHLLKPYNPQVRIIGHASSAASVLMMCAGKDKLVAEEGSLSLLHPALGGTQGNAKEQRKAADMLDKITASAKKIYMTRFNGTEQELDDILELETIHDAEQLQKWGLIDEVKKADSELSSEEMLQEANAWMEDVKNLLNEPSQYVSNYIEMIDNKYRPKQTFNNNKEEEDMSITADMQAKYNEEYSKNLTLSAELKAKEKELDTTTAELTTLKDEFATMKESNSVLEKQIAERTAELDKLKAEMSKVESEKVNNTIEAFLNENDKKFVASQRDAFKMVLESAHEKGEDAFKLAKENIEKMPVNPTFVNTEDKGRADNESVEMTAEEALKMDWSNVDFTTPEGDAKLHNAVLAVMKANPALSELEAENKLMEAK